MPAEQTPVLNILFSLLARLPLPLLHAVGATIGWLFFLFPNHHRRIAERNLQLCFPDKTLLQRRELLRQHLMETGKALLETPMMWSATTQRLAQLVREVRHPELLENAMKEGSGVILISPHIGSWEYIGFYSAQRHPMTCMYRPPRNKTVAPYMLAGRQRMGITLAPTDTSGIRTLLQTLKRGELVGILPDQDPREQGGVFAPFFGIPANTISLLPRLASRSKARLLFGIAERLPWGRGFRIHFLPAPEGSDSEDAAVAATAINKGVEQCVAIAPAQYQWGYKRFRTRPEGEASVYKREA